MFSLKANKSKKLISDGICIKFPREIKFFVKKWDYKRTLPSLSNCAIFRQDLEAISEQL